MANEPSWDELFNPQPKASEPAQPAPDPAPQQPVNTDPFAELFAGFETGPVPAAPAPPAPPAAQLPPSYPPVAPPQAPLTPPVLVQPLQPQPPQAPQAPVQPPAQPPVQAPVHQQPYPSDWPVQPAVGAPPAAAQTPAPAPAQPPVQQNSPATESFDPFAELFANQESSAPAPAQSANAPTPDGSVPLTRRELREREAGATPVALVQSAADAPPASFPAASFSAAVAPDAFPGAAPTPAASASAGFPFDFGTGSAGGGGGFGGSGDGGGGYYTPEKPRKRRRLLWLKITLPIVLVLGAIGGAAAFAWFNYEDQVRELMGWEIPNDFAGTGNGVEVIVTIQSGEIGSDIASTLHDKGVTMTFDAFYELLLAQAENVNFLPGNYVLQKEMSAQSALDALLDPANKLTSKLLLTEGTTLPSALEIMAETTGIALEEFQTAATDFQQFGLPAQAPSLEGYLFPATYDLDGTETAVGLLQLLVDTMYEHLDDAGVPVEMRHEILTKASIIQREAGSNQDDFYKIARVFQNRIDQGINLQSDATVAYGTGNLHTVWTTDAERADASNLYNTYANAGLPIGPIGLPGDLAIAAAMTPADGPWLFFVPINLATGETVFSETADQHEAAVDVLREWCRASPENASYCE